VKTYSERSEPEFEVERYAPRAPMGWEEPVASEPFLIREVQQYLINSDSIGMRWDIAWLKDGMVHQVFVQYRPYFIQEPTEADRLQWREKAREMLRAEVSEGGQHFRLKLPAGTYRADYV
jgi:hypothetical protein